MTNALFVLSERASSAVSAATQTATENEPSKKRAIESAEVVVRKGKIDTQVA